jgi:predicted flap endonuclease-1-like 5' DNA nuclease
MVMKQKVSQATIDKIKKMGMTKALKSASNASPEMKEGLKRMYGAKRLAAATGSTKPMQMTARSAERSTPMKSTSNARIADRKTPVAKKAAAPMAKKSTTTDPFAKAVFGIGPGLNALQRKIGATSPADRAAASNRKPVSNTQKMASVAATNAKRMGISVAEYNRRLNAKKK